MQPTPQEVEQTRQREVNLQALANLVLFYAPACFTLGWGATGLAERRGMGSTPGSSWSRPQGFPGICGRGNAPGWSALVNTDSLKAA